MYRLAAVSGIASLILSAPALVLVGAQWLDRPSEPLLAIIFIIAGWAASMLLSLGLYRIGQERSRFLMRSEIAAMTMYTLLSGYLIYAVLADDFSLLWAFVAGFGLTAGLVGIAIHGLGERLARLEGVVHTSAGILLASVVFAVIAIPLLGISTVLASILLWKQ